MRPFFYALLFACVSVSLRAGSVYLSNGSDVPILVNWVSWSASDAYLGNNSVSVAPGACVQIPRPYFGSGGGLTFSMTRGTKVPEGYTFATGNQNPITLAAAPETSDHYITWSGNYYYGFYGSGAVQERAHAGGSAASAFPLVLLFLGGMYFSQYVLRSSLP